MDEPDIDHLQAIIFEFDNSSRGSKAEFLTLFLEEICRDVESHSSNIHDPKYLSRFDKFINLEVDQDVSYADRRLGFKNPPVSSHDLYEFLEGKMELSIEEEYLGENFHYGPHRWEFYLGAFYIYISSLIVDNYYSADEIESVLDFYEDDFGSEAIYHYLRAKVKILQTDSDSYRDAIKESSECVEVDSRNYYFLLLQGKSLRLYFSATESQLDINDLPTNRDELLQFAADQIERAVILNPNWKEAYSEWSHILQLQQEYEEAEKKLSKAIQINQQDIDTDQEWHSNASLQMRGLRRERQHVQRTQEYLKDARQEIEDLQDEIAESRNQTIRFIGFFAGIIAIVVSTAPIASNTTSVNQASQIILVLTGGLIIAFVGLGTVFSDSRRSLWRLLIPALLGFLLLGLGLLAPSIVP